MKVVGCGRDITCLEFDLMVCNFWKW